MNNLGITPLMELMIVVGEAIAQLQLEHSMVVECVYHQLLVRTK
jgi:dihydroxyacetone kinase